MNSRHPSIRALGQRSIPSSFLLRSSNRSNDSKEDVQFKSPPPKKDFRVSLSGFLDRKLYKTSKTVQGKQKPFSSLVGPGSGDLSGSIRGQIDEVVFERFKHSRKEKEDFIGSFGVGEVGMSEVDGMQESRKRRNPFEGGDERNTALKHLVVLGDDLKPKQKGREQVEHSRNEKEDCTGSYVIGEVGRSDIDDMQEPRKRSNTFEGGDEKHTARKHLVVLGDDPKPKQKGREESFISNKKQRSLYNHYANGSGWWDCNMEGVDNEEVGCNEVWEGIGSTTLGGLGGIDSDYL